MASVLDKSLRILESDDSSDDDELLNLRPIFTPKPKREKNKQPLIKKPVTEHKKKTPKKIPLTNEEIESKGTSSQFVLTRSIDLFIHFFLTVSPLLPLLVIFVFQ